MLVLFAYIQLHSQWECELSPELEYEATLLVTSLHINYNCCLEHFQ